MFRKEAFHFRPHLVALSATSALWLIMGHCLSIGHSLSWQHQISFISSSINHKSWWATEAFLTVVCISQDVIIFFIFFFTGCTSNIVLMFCQMCRQEEQREMTRYSLISVTLRTYLHFTSVSTNTKCQCQFLLSHAPLIFKKITSRGSALRLLT